MFQGQEKESVHCIATDATTTDKRCVNCLTHSAASSILICIIREERKELLFLKHASRLRLSDCCTHRSRADQGRSSADDLLVHGLLGWCTACLWWQHEARWARQESDGAAAACWAGN